MMAGMLTTSIASALVIARTGRCEAFPVVSGAVATLGLYLLSCVRPDVSTVELGVYLIMLGVGIGPVTQVLVIAAQNAVDFADLGVATSGVTFFRSVGGSFRVTVAGSTFTSRLIGDLERVARTVGLPPGSVWLVARLGARGLRTGAALAERAGVTVAEGRPYADALAERGLPRRSEDGRTLCLTPEGDPVPHPGGGAGGGPAGRRGARRARAAGRRLGPDRRPELHELLDRLPRQMLGPAADRPPGG